MDGDTRCDFRSAEFAMAALRSNHIESQHDRGSDELLARRQGGLKPLKAASSAKG